MVQRNYIVDHVSYKVILFATQQLCQQSNGFFVKSVDLVKIHKWNNKEDINQWWIYVVAVNSLTRNDHDPEAVTGQAQ